MWFWVQEPEKSWTLKPQTPYAGIMILKLVRGPKVGKASKLSKFGLSGFGLRSLCFVI